MSKVSNPAATTSPAHIATLAASVAPGNVDVFLIAGQSNGRGIGTSSLSPTVPTGKVLRYGHDGSIADANDPLTNAVNSGQNANTGCAWPTFGLTLFNATQRKVLFVQTCHGATSQVNLGNPATTWDTGGTLFPQAIAGLNAALTAAIAAGYAPVFRGVLWCQGEQDAIAINGSMITQGQYITALTAMIARFRAATIGGTTYPAMPFYLFRTGTDPSQSDVGFASVRAAQDSTIASDPHSEVVFRDTIKFPALGYQQAVPNSIHYTQAGYNEMGRVGAANVLGAITASIAASGQSNSSATD